MGGWRLALFSRRRKCRRCCAFLESDMVLVVQVRSSVMCTPRNLVLLNLYSRAVDGQWGVVNGVPPPEVQHNLLCLLHIEGQIVSATPCRPHHVDMSTMSCSFSAECGERFLNSSMTTILTFSPSRSGIPATRRFHLRL